MNKQQILDYTIANSEKFNRAVNGVIGKQGQLQGGVGEEATDIQKLAEYDRIGGLILKGKYKVKTGSFYDFKKRQIREKPDVYLVFRDLEGNEVELKEDEPIPLEVKAAEVAQEKKSKRKVKKADDEE